MVSCSYTSKNASTHSPRGGMGFSDEEVWDCRILASGLYIIVDCILRTA